MSRERKVRRALVAVVESMEQRTLLSAGTVLGADGTLTVNGTEVADRIGVQREGSNIVVDFFDPSGSTSLLSSSFDASKVKNIVVNVLGGNDNLDVEAHDVG